MELGRGFAWAVFAVILAGANWLRGPTPPMLAAPYPVAAPQAAESVAPEVKPVGLLAPAEGSRGKGVQKSRRADASPFHLPAAPSAVTPAGTSATFSASVAP